MNAFELDSAWTMSASLERALPEFVPSPFVLSPFVQSPFVQSLSIESPSTRATCARSSGWTEPFAGSQSIMLAAGCAASSESRAPCTATC